MTTRNGKIARLPKAVREELNHRLENGELASRLVAWLNAPSEVRAVLAPEFSGQAINEQNLTAWRQGGYQDWLRHQESRDLARSLAEEAKELANESGQVLLGESLSALVALILGRLLRKTAEAGGEPAERRGALVALAHELARLRRGDHQAARLRLEQERWAAVQAETDRKKESAKQFAPFYGLLLATWVGDMCKDEVKETGEVSPVVLAFLSATNPEQARAAGPSAETLQMLGIKSNQGQPRSIKADQTPCT